MNTNDYYLYLIYGSGKKPDEKKVNWNSKLWQN